jgi:hypothetical protein
MPLLHKKLLQKSLEELEDEFCRSLTIEQRLTGISASELLKHIPPEEILRVRLIEERLKDLSPEERLIGLSPKERASLKKLLK